MHKAVGIPIHVWDCGYVKSLVIPLLDTSPSNNNTLSAICLQTNTVSSYKIYLTNNYSNINNISDDNYQVPCLGTI